MQYIFKLIIILISFVIIYGCGTNQESNEYHIRFYNLNDGNQDKLILYREINKDSLNSLQHKYSWDKFDEYDNKMWAYTGAFIDKLNVEINNQNDEIKYFNELNRSQKAFYVFLNFNGQVDNGGVHQFFFNRPEYSYAILQSFEEIGLTQLLDDYKKCYSEFLGSQEEIINAKKNFNNDNLDWEKRYNEFRNGKKDIPSSKLIESYYYDPKFKKELFIKVTDYVDKHLNDFVKIKK